MIFRNAAYKINTSTMAETAFQYNYDDKMSSSVLFVLDFDIKPYTFKHCFLYRESFYEMRDYWGTDYKFNAKPACRCTGHRVAGRELDNETGMYYYGARYYTPELSIWLSVDPLSDKYPSMSPFMYCAGNPMKYIDPDGRDLDVAMNEESKRDLKSIVSLRNRDRVNINDQGNVTVNLDGLSNRALKRDKGLNLINDMVNSDKKMLFETTDIALLNDENNNKFGFPVNIRQTGGFNASNYGKDSNNGYTLRPADGYDGHVGVSMSGNFNFKNNGDNARRSVIFHELSENFYRTHFGYDYHGKSRGGNDNYGAHYRASMREGNYFGNSSPGGNIRFSGSTKPVKEIYPVINNHYRGF